MASIKALKDLYGSTGDMRSQHSNHGSPMKKHSSKDVLSPRRSTSLAFKGDPGTDRSSAKKRDSLLRSRTIMNEPSDDEVEKSINSSVEEADGTPKIKRMPGESKE